MSLAQKRPILVVRFKRKGYERNLSLNRHMEIFFSDIPPEGLHQAGEFPSSIFELPPGDTIRPMGSVSYDVMIYAFDELIAFSGRLSGPFQLQCTTCLEFVDYLANFPEWSSDLNVEEGQKSFDLMEVIRDEFLLNLPSYARCDELSGGRECPKAEVVAEIEESTDQPNPDRSDVWGALDDIL